LCAASDTPALSSGAISGYVTKTTFTRAQAGSVKVSYTISRRSNAFVYVLSIKSGTKYQLVKQVAKKGSFRGRRTMTMPQVFAGRPIRVGRYRLVLSCDKGRLTLTFRVVAKPPVPATNQPIINPPPPPKPTQPNKMVVNITNDWNSTAYPQVAHGHSEAQVTFVRNPSYDPQQSDSQMWTLQSGNWSETESGVDLASWCQSPYDQVHPSYSATGNGTNFQEAQFSYEEGKELNVYLVSADPYTYTYTCPAGFSYSSSTFGSAAVQLPNQYYDRVTLSGTYTWDDGNGKTGTDTWTITPELTPARPAQASASSPRRARARTSSAGP